MSHRPSAFVNSEQAGGNVSGAIARAHLLDTERDRPKRIDQYIDYFGDGGRRDDPFKGPTVTAGRS